ncbi:chaplin [Streptomyces sp. NPDC059900]|uniref:chaplin n=1 Tax=Streptomyces sp. NPDC059900 TaxID=3155816 RepID=UPI0034228210
MRIRTIAATAALACVTVLGGATAATAAPADPPPPSNSQSDEGPTGLGLNLLCGLGVLGQGSCSN